mmetsp:Transcript_34936/g.64691  ORF Transcript_34936/g.64691 Transcript_34936/m.64691 type:complete len:99 (+) Transcript_34936:221-517(+)
MLDARRLPGDESNSPHDYCRNTNDAAHHGSAKTHGCRQDYSVVLVVLQSVDKEYASTKFGSEIVSAHIEAVYSGYRIPPKKGHNWGHSGKRLWVVNIT